jgi:hypothetical protein
LQAAKAIFRVAGAIAALAPVAASAADLGAAPDFYYTPPPSAPVASTSWGIFGDATLSATFLANDLTDDDWAVSLGGVFVFPLGAGWSASLQANNSYLFEADDWSSAIEANLFYVTPTWAAGAFATVATDDVYVLGGEVALFVNNVDLVGELGYVFGDTDAIDAAAGAYYYFTPDTYVGLEVGSTWFDGGGDYQTALVGVEHRFANTPVTGFLDAGWDNAGGDNFHVTAGSRILFGGPTTLQEYFRANPF